MASGTSPDSARPRIGLTTSLELARTGVWERPSTVLPGVYLDAVHDAGGVSLLLPPQPVDAALVRAVLDGVDALVLTGGADVHPQRYGQLPHATVTRTQPERDAWEFALLGEALARDLPVLGVCRGAQVLNTALGGTLHQHLPDVVGHGDHQPGPARFGTTTVHLDQTSRLGRLLAEAEAGAGSSSGAGWGDGSAAAGHGLQVHCHHHQAVDELGDGLTVVGRASDGVVEAVEVPGAAFVVGVQWHTEEDRHDRRLVAVLVDAARAGAAAGAA